MTMKEDWTEQLRRKLEGHQVPPPEGLWESISKELGLDEKSVRKPVTRRWYWAAAAAILALVGFFVFHDSNDGEQPQQVSAVPQQSVPQQSISVQSVSEPLAEADPVESRPQTTVPLLALAHHQVPVTQSQAEEDQPSVTEHQTEEVRPDAPTDSSSETQQSLDEPQMKKSSEITDNYTAYQYEPTPRHPAHSTSGKWSFGLNASGGLLAQAGPLDQDYLKSGIDIDHTDYTEELSIGTQLNPYSKSLTNQYNTHTEYVWKHHLPIRLGISVQYQLNNHLALLSGINYTRLSSEFGRTRDPNRYDQKLQYLGVPVGLVWQLWTNNHLRFYLSGGMMLEKCVSFDLEGGCVLNQKPWQWSVDAAAGAEYTFIRQLGIYLEPSLGYYFDDGTPLEHYYKEHPFAPSIEFGLRLHLNK